MPWYVWVLIGAVLGVGGLLFFILWVATDGFKNWMGP